MVAIAHAHSSRLNPLIRLGLEVMSVKCSRECLTSRCDGIGRMARTAVLLGRDVAVGSDCADAIINAGRLGREGFAMILWIESQTTEVIALIVFMLSYVATAGANNQPGLT